MEGLDLKQMSSMVKVIAEEKGLPEESVLNIIETAIAAAWRKENGDKDMNVRAVLNLDNGEAEVFVAKEVIEDGLAYNPATEIPADLAGGKEIGEIVEESHKVTSFGRVASMTAKQVIVQRLREAEHEAILTVYEDKINTIVNGTIARVEPKLVRVDLGKATGIMLKQDQIEGEFYKVGSRIKVLIKAIERNERGADLVVLLNLSNSSLSRRSLKLKMALLKSMLLLARLVVAPRSPFLPPCQVLTQLVLLLVVVVSVSRPS